MSDHLGNLPTSPEDNLRKSPPIEGHPLEDADQARGLELGQSLYERRQRARIGERAANIVTFLPLVLLVSFWGFLIKLVFYASPHKAPFDVLENLSALFGVMFSVTHIGIIALYYALIKGMFQKIGEDKADKAGKPPDAQSPVADQAISTIRDISQEP